jgi:hypothetical protein
MKLLRNMLAALLAAAALVAAAQQAPFAPASTTNIAVTASAQTFTLPSVMVGVNRQMVLTNVGSQTVFAVCDGTLSAAPTTATTSNGMPLLANSQVVITMQYTISSCSVIAAAVGSTLYATSGIGQ